MNKRKDYTLSNLQKIIWSYEMHHPNNCIGNNFYSCKLEHTVDFEILEKAINHCIKSNSILRLQIHEKDGKPNQYIANYKKVKVDHFDFYVNNGEKLLQALIDDLVQITLAMPDSELYSFTMLRYPGGDEGFLVGIHQLIADTVSCELLINHIIKTYYSLKKGACVMKQKICCKRDFLVINERYKKSSQYSIDQDYWHKKLEGIDNIARLKPYENKSEITAKQTSYLIEEHVLYTYNMFCETHETTVKNLFIAAMYIYIMKKTGKTDFIFAASSNNRGTDSESHLLMGMFDNYLLARLSMKDTDITFSDLLTIIHAEFNDIHNHKQYPFESILKYLDEKENIGKKIIELLLTYEDIEKADKNNIQMYHNNVQIYPLIITISNNPDEGILLVEIKYQEKLYTNDEIKELFQAMITILNNALENPEQQIMELLERNCVPELTSS